MNKKILGVVTFALLCVLSACEKDNSLASTSLSTVDTTKPFIKFINASPESPIINFYIDSKKATGTYTTSGVEAGMAYPEIYPSGYSQSNGGSIKLSTIIAGDSSVDPGVVISEINTDLAAEKYYSVFAVDRYDAVNKKQNLLIIEDKKPILDTSKAFLRVINLQVNRPKADMILSTGENLFSGVEYKKATEFISIPDPGKENTYTFKNTETGTLIPITLKSTLGKGRAYTLVLRGIAGTTSGVNAHAFTLYSNW